jgi:transcriptional regulator with XRE-family HTH domain
MKLGVDVRTVEVWEEVSDTPRANLIQMLAGLLNVSIVWLISGEGTGSSSVADTFGRPLGEISQLKASLAGAVDQLHERLLEIQ